MGLNANTAAGGGTKFALMEAGTYPARLAVIADLGLQTQRPFQGAEKAPAQEISLTYEFVDEFLKDEDGQDMKDKPRWLTETMAFFNIGAEKAKSTARYKAADPSGVAEGDWTRLLGAPVMVTIVLNPNKKQKGAFWENIAEVTAMRAKDAARVPALVNPPKFFNFDEPDLEVFLSLPKFIQKKIKESLVYPSSQLEDMLKGSSPDKAPAATVASEETDESDENPY